MTRYSNVISSILIFLGSLFVILSIAGIIAIWVYRGPLLDQANTRLAAHPAVMPTHASPATSSPASLMMAHPPLAPDTILLF